MTVRPGLEVLLDDPKPILGRFTMSAVPRTTAWARDREAMGVDCRDSDRMSSPKPGMNLSAMERVASGVMSLRAIPVPPVVTTSAA